MVRAKQAAKGRRSENPLAHRAEIDKLADKARLAISVIGGLLALAFGWVQLKDFPFIPLLESTQAEFVLKVALALYYFSWVFGTNFDVKLQQDVYVRDRDHGRLGWRAASAIAGFGVVAAALLWVSDDEKRFAAVLTVFVVMNAVGWRVVMTRVTSIVHMTLLLVGGDFFERERLRAVEEYISGNWQWHRFLAMGLIALIGDVICFFPAVRMTISSMIASVDFGLKGAVVSQLLPAFVFVSFLVLAEGWIWAIRIKARLSLSLISDLKGRYEL